MSGLLIAGTISLLVPQQAPLIMGIYSAATWCSVAALLLRDWIRLERYLRQKHPKKWAELTIPGTDSLRPWALLRFLRSGGILAMSRSVLKLLGRRLLVERSYAASVSG
jgi:hypothetical protein